MNCPVCNRNNTVKLSICPSCGAMIDDTVRQELVGKVSAAVSVSKKPVDFELKNKPMPLNKINQLAADTAARQSKPETAPKNITAELSPKTTNPTLVEFHSRHATVPEWRLQLQNVVRQRQERDVAMPATATIETEAAPSVQLVTSGANALKAETVPQPQILQHKNPTLNSALERIEKSRRQFLANENQPVAADVASAAPPVPVKAAKNYPFHIAPKTSDAVAAAAAKPAETNPPVGAYAKPKLAAPASRLEKEKLDTNKLPPLSKLIAPTATPNFESLPVVEDEAKPAIEEFAEVKTETPETVKNETVEVEEYEDYAPYSMRFNAGLFDLIIGSFTSLFLLSPFMLSSGNWFSAAGVFGFLAVCAVVMFLYLTTAIGIYGRTFGMRLFSLEIIDIETEDFPSFHQAAVSSAVYLLTLALGGIGFLFVFYNDDRRAAHDLLSGTLVVKED